MLFSSVF